MSEGQPKRHKREPRETQTELFKGLSRSKTALEREMAARHGAVAGVDEVGRGCIAGPVVAAAVILPADAKVRGITDSKLLTPEKREALDAEIRGAALAIGIGVVENDEIDRVNILNASLEAMRLAVAALTPAPGFLLVDGVFRIPHAVPQQPVVKGDLKCRCIGAASIVAKVFRDRRMVELDAVYPEYGFASHKGYGCKPHWKALDAHGPCAIHRKSFYGVLPGSHVPAGQGALAFDAVELDDEEEALVAADAEAEEEG